MSHTSPEPRAPRFVMRRVHVVMGLLAVAIALFAVSRAPWVHVSAAGATGRVALAGSGSEVAAAVSACAVVLGAAAVAVTLAGRRAYGVILGLAGLASLVAAGDSFRVFLQPAAAGAELVASATGASGSAVAASATFWPWVSIVVAVVGLVCVVAGFSARPRGTSSRFEPAGEAGAGPAVEPAPGEDPAGAWDALSRGDDPTSARDDLP